MTLPFAAEACLLLTSSINDKVINKENSCRPCAEFEQALGLGIHRIEAMMVKVKFGECKPTLNS
jgi:hypothetical protein